MGTHPKRSNNAADVLKNFAPSWTPDNALKFVNQWAQKELNNKNPMTGAMDNIAGLTNSSVVKYNAATKRLEVNIKDDPDSVGGRCSAKFLEKQIANPNITDSEKIALFRSYTGMDGSDSGGKYDIPIVNVETQVGPRGAVNVKKSLSNIGMALQGQEDARQYQVALVNLLNKYEAKKQAGSATPVITRKINIAKDGTTTFVQPYSTREPLLRTDGILDLSVNPPRLLHKEDVILEAYKAAGITDPQGERAAHLQAQFFANSTGAASSDVVSSLEGTNTTLSDNVKKTNFRVGPDGRIIGAAPLNPQGLDYSYYKDTKAYPGVYAVKDVSANIFYYSGIAVVGLTQIAGTKIGGALLSAILPGAKGAETIYKAGVWLLHHVYHPAEHVLNGVKVVNGVAQTQLPGVTKEQYEAAANDIFTNPSAALLMSAVGFLPASFWTYILGQSVVGYLAPLGGPGLFVGLAWTGLGLYAAEKKKDEAKEKLREKIRDGADKEGFYVESVIGPNASVVKDYVIQLQPNQVYNPLQPIVGKKEITYVVPDGAYKVPISAVNTGKLDDKGNLIIDYVWSKTDLLNYTIAVKEGASGGTINFLSPGGRPRTTKSENSRKSIIRDDQLKNPYKLPYPYRDGRGYQDNLRPRQYNYFNNFFSPGISPLPYFDSQSELETNDQIIIPYLLGRQSDFLAQNENVSNNNTSAGYSSDASGPENCAVFVKQTPESAMDVQDELENLRKVANKDIHTWYRSNGDVTNFAWIDTPNENNTIGLGRNDGSGTGTGRDADDEKVIKREAVVEVGRPQVIAMNERKDKGTPAYFAELRPRTIR